MAWRRVDESCTPPGEVIDSKSVELRLELSEPTADLGLVGVGFMTFDLTIEKEKKKQMWNIQYLLLYILY